MFPAAVVRHDEVRLTQGMAKRLAFRRRDKNRIQDIRAISAVRIFMNDAAVAGYTVSLLFTLQMTRHGSESLLCEAGNPFG